MSKSPTPKMYVPGANLEHDRLVQAYERLEKEPPAPEAETRTSDDPFGLRAPVSRPTDPFHRGKEAAQRLNQFLGLLIDEGQLTPEQVYFATELTALCVFNQDPPKLSKIDGDAARQAAYRYWQQATGKPRDPG